MKLAGRIRPLSDLQDHTAEMVRSVAEDRQPLVITEGGTAKAVLQDIESFEQTQETLALLKILALGNMSLDEGRVSPAREAFARIRARLES